MAVIRIGSGYKKEFESICNLYRHKFLSDKVNIKSVTDTEIRTSAHTFVYDGELQGVGGEGESSELKFGSRGASWFSGLRGASFDSSSADWEQLIADVAADYHKYYSMIEFRQTAEKRAEAMDGVLRGLLQKFNSEFIRRVFGGGFDIPDKYTAAPEHFYAVSMRLEINGGAQSEPLLGKVYLRQAHDGRYVPIKRSAAEDIDDYINGAVPSDDESEATGKELVDGELVGDVLGRIGDLFDGDDCADYVLFNSEFIPKIQKMLKLLATSDEKELECTHVTVLGISHVEWQNFAYPVIANGKKVLKLIVGLNNSISLYCTNCSKDGVPLIDNNEVLFDDPKYSGKYLLDSGKTGFGLDADAVSEILSYAKLAEHVLPVECPENPRSVDCSHIICAAQAVQYKGADGKVVRKCKGCPYPEVVYHDIFAPLGDSGKLTVSLDIDEQAFTLTENKTKVCKCCGRRFTVGKNGYCTLCGSAEPTDDGRRLYRKYGKMLGVGVRLKHLFSDKFCTEDSNMIIFQLGDDRFVFDKLDISESGYVVPPRKVDPKKKGGK